MIDGPEFFPLAIGWYREHADLDVKAELDAVTSALQAFNVRVQDWTVKMDERGADNVHNRISMWRNADHPETFLYWVGHGWTNNADTAVLYHANSERDSGDVGVTPADMAKAIAGRLYDEDMWAIVVVDACGSKRFIELLKTELLHKTVAGRYLLVGGLSGEGATNLGRFSRDLDHLLNVTFRSEFDIELGKLADEFERLNATVERKRLVDIVLRRRHAVLVNSALDVTAELETALSQLSDDELRHFLPKAHGGELPFKETVLGEQSWYFEGRKSETRHIIDWLATAQRGALVVTGPAGSGKSALLGHLVVHSNPTLRTALSRAGVLEEVAEGDRPSDGAFDLVLHLTGTSPEEIVTRIAEGIGAGEPPSGSVSESTRWLCEQFVDRRLTTILVDALDEAIDPLTVARVVLGDIAGVSTVRLLIGTRPSTHEGPDYPAPDANLLDALGSTAIHLRIDRDDTAIERYVARRLHRTRGTLAVSVDAAGFARAVREKQRQFLFARLAVHEVLADRRWHDPSTWDALLGQDHQHLFGVAVDRLAGLHPSHRPLLRALAFARGRGVPDQGGLWVTLAHALEPGLDVSEDDVQRLVNDAAPSVLGDREHGQTVYRLAHRTFAEFFTRQTNLTNVDCQANSAILQALIKAASADLSAMVNGSKSLNPYLTHFLSAHAGFAGERGWHQLDENRDVLIALDPESVAQDVQRYAFGRLTLPSAISGVLVSWQLLQRADVRDRGLVLQIAIAQILATTVEVGGLKENYYRANLRWAALTRVAPHRVLAHTSPVNSVAAVPLSNGRTLVASGSGDGTVRLWDPVTGHPVGEPLTGHTSEVYVVAAVMLPNGRSLLASGSIDATVRLWDPATGRSVGEPLTGHVGSVNAIAAVPLPDGRTLLATGSTDAIVRLWDLPTGRPVGAPLAGHTGSVNAVAAVPLPDGRTLLASGSIDATVRLWDPATGRSIGEPLIGHSGSVFSVATVPSPDGRTLLATGSTDAKVRLWDVTTGYPVGRPMTGHTGWVRTVAAVPLPDGRNLLATGSSDATLWLWDPDTGRSLGEPLTGHTGWVRAVAAVPVPDGRTLLASGSDDGTVRLWDPVADDSMGESVASHTDWVRAVVAVAALPDGRTLLATGSIDATVRMWDATTGNPAGEPLTGHTSSVNAVAALPQPDGRILLASGSSDRRARLWDADSGRPVGEPLSGHIASVTAVAMVPLKDRATLLATGSADDTVRLWDTDSGRPVGEPLTGHVGSVNAVVAVSWPDGRVLLASGSDDTTVRLWDPASGRAVGEPLTGHVSWVRAVAAVPLPDGRILLASGSNDMTIRLWDPASGRAVGQPLTGHTDRVNTVAAVPLLDGRTLLATGSDDATVRLWHLATNDSAQDILTIHIGRRVENICAVGSSSLAVVSHGGLMVISLGRL
ncbi:hypothetical protein ACFVAV_35380 [Nocardia sp. NPDC057663]|uniref:hypothetical protein n=1 Tax=Nocardia sp. NPDC057663 TaxID=3346201 RepID=UPI003672D088